MKFVCLALLITLFSTANAALKTGGKQKPFPLIGFAKVSEVNSQVIELKTFTGIYYLDRSMFMDMNRKYLKGVKANQQIVVKVSGKMIKKFEMKPDQETVRR